MDGKIVENGCVLTMSRGESEKVYPDGAVRIDGNEIAAVGPRSEISDDGADVIDADGGIIMPGLINGHNHYEQSFMKAITRLYTGTTYEWINNLKIPITSEMTADDYYLSNALTCLEMIKSGVTCSVNHLCQHNPDTIESYGIAESMRAIEDAGVRTVVPIGVADTFEAEENLTDPERFERLLRDTFEQWHKSADGRIRVWPGPAGVFSATDEMWDVATDLAAEYDTGIHTHLATAEHGEVAVFEEYDALSERLVGAHCVWLSDSELTTMAANDVKTVHNPTYKLGYAVDSEVEEYGDGIAPMTDYLSKGGTVGLGQDGCMGDTQDMFKEMRVFAFTQHYKYRDKELYPPSKLLELATIECAKALHWDDDIGSLEPGKKADLIVLDMDELKFVPKLNELANIVYQATAEDVETVLINGEIVMADRTIQTLDESTLKSDAQQAADDLLTRAGVADLFEKGVDPWESGHSFE